MKSVQIPPSHDTNNTNSQSSFSPPSSPSPSSSSFFSFFQNMMIHPCVWLLGLVMCLINISFVMIFSLSALYLNTNLNVNLFLINLLEGVVEGISFIMKLFSGIISDYFRRRKPIMLIGFFFTVISKPMFAISSNFFHVFFARLFERVGNGIQSTPRDAMVGDVAPATHRASNFGMLRTLGTAGSCLGGLLGAAAMYYTDSNFQQVFFIAAIPAMLAFLILALFVKEPDTRVSQEGTVVKIRSDRRPIRFKDLNSLGKNYWILMIVVGIFMMARFSETQLVLHAHKNFGLAQQNAPYIMFLYNITYSLFSYPCGIIADKMGRKIVLVLGMLALILSDFLLYSATGLTQVFVGIFLWGIQLAAVHNTFVSLITDYVPDDLRGTSIGFYYLVSAMGSIFVGVFNGSITHYYGYTAMFGCSMIIAICAMLALLILLPNKQKKAAA